MAGPLFTRGISPNPGMMSRRRLLGAALGIAAVGAACAPEPTPTFAPVKPTELPNPTAGPGVLRPVDNSQVLPKPAEAPKPAAAATVVDFAKPKVDATAVPSPTSIIEGNRKKLTELPKDIFSKEALVKEGITLFNMSPNMELHFRQGAMELPEVKQFIGKRGAKGAGWNEEFRIVILDGAGSMKEKIERITEPSVKLDLQTAFNNTKPEPETLMSFGSVDQTRKTARDYVVLDVSDMVKNLLTPGDDTPWMPKSVRTGSVKHGEGMVPQFLKPQFETPGQALSFQLNYLLSGAYAVEGNPVAVIEKEKVLRKMASASQAYLDADVDTRYPFIVKDTRSNAIIRV